MWNSMLSIKSCGNSIHAFTRKEGKSLNILEGIFLNISVILGLDFYMALQLMALLKMNDCYSEHSMLYQAVS